MGKHTHGRGENVRQGRTSMIHCYVCQLPATISAEPAIATKRVDCPQCGTYSISADSFACVPADEHWNQVKALLSLALRWASHHDAPAVLTDGGDVGVVVAAYEIALLHGG